MHPEHPYISPTVLEVGDRVAYSRDALRTHGSAYAGLKGTIVSIVDHAPGWTLATVCWAPAAFPDSEINIRQLSRIGSLAHQGA